MLAIEKTIKAKLKYKQLVHEMADSLDSSGITYSELEVMYIINKHQQTQPSKIADELFQERASVSRILKDLFDRDLIKYVHSTQDRRKVSVSLSKKGSQLLTKSF